MLYLSSKNSSSEAILILQVKLLTVVQKIMEYSIMHCVLFIFISLLLRRILLCTMIKRTNQIVQLIIAVKYMIGEIYIIFIIKTRIY